MHSDLQQMLVLKSWVLKEWYGIINLIKTKLFPNHWVSSIKSIKGSYDLRPCVFLFGVLFSVARTDRDLIDFTAIWVVVDGCVITTVCVYIHMYIYVCLCWILGFAWGHMFMILRWCDWQDPSETGTPWLLPSADRDLSHCETVSVILRAYNLQCSTQRQRLCQCARQRAEGLAWPTEWTQQHTPLY